MAFRGGMFVVKRDGRKQEVHFDKITARIMKLSYNLNPEFCDPVSIGLVLGGRCATARAVVSLHLLPYLLHASSHPIQCCRAGYCNNARAPSLAACVHGAALEDSVGWLSILGLNSSAWPIFDPPRTHRCSPYPAPAQILVAQKVAAGVYKGVTTSELDELAAETAAALTSTHPDYATVSAHDDCCASTPTASTPRCVCDTHAGGTSPRCSTFCEGVCVSPG
eukprot:1159294-Pelagomonas_calceolata.AAC.6